MNFKMNKKRWIILVIILVVGFFIFQAVKPKKDQYQFIEVKRGNISSIVSLTGKVKPAEDINLSVERAGRISQVNAKVGEKVNRGQILFAIDSSELIAQKSQAEASVSGQQAKLDELKKGARTEDVQVVQSQYDKAQTDLNNAYKNAVATLNQAYNTVDSVMRQQISALLTYHYYGSASEYELSYTTCRAEAGNQSVYQRKKLDGILAKWNSDNNAINWVNSSTNNYSTYIDPAIINAKQNLETVLTFLNKLNETLEVDCSLSSSQLSTITTNKTTLNTAITNVNTAITNVNTLKNTIDSYKLTAQVAQDQLNLKKAQATPEQIAYQEAQLRSAQASLDLINVQIGKTLVIAPSSGTITKVDAQVGEDASMGKIYVAMISDKPFQIEANVSENDIAKIALGNKCIITFDSFGPNRKFSASIASIDPAETLIDGVSSYKTTFMLDEINNEIRSGMTANIDIVAAEKSNVLFVPNRLTTKHTGSTTVKILENGKEKEIEVQTGLKGADGNIEIISGLKEGDRIISNAK